MRRGSKTSPNWLTVLQRVVVAACVLTIPGVVVAWRDDNRIAGIGLLLALAALLVSAFWLFPIALRQGCLDRHGDET